MPQVVVMALLLEKRFSGSGRAVKIRERIGERE
jgi:hypothetical protein